MPVIGLATPIYETVDAWTHGVLIELAAAWGDLMPADWKLRPSNRRGGPVDVNRTWIAQQMLLDVGPDGQGSPITGRAADIILWNDSDCLLANPLQYRTLIQSLLDAPPQVGAIGVAFPCQTEKEEIPNLCPIVGPDGRRVLPTDGNIHEVEWLGFGCIATRAEVYRHMKQPFFRFDWKPFQLTVEDARGGGVKLEGSGEDAQWCYDARAAGYITMVHTGIVGLHSFRSPRRLKGGRAT